MSDTPGCYIQGRGLVSALGLDLPAALACLAAGGVSPVPTLVAPDARAPDARSAVRGPVRADTAASEPNADVH